MSTGRLVRHVRQQYVGYIALSLALSTGVAWAVEKNSVKSAHIVNGQVKAADLAGANTLYGSAPNINGSTKVLFAYPQMGFRLRADGDLDSDDVGVQVENSRGPNGKDIYVLEGGGGVFVTPAGGIQPSYRPSVADFIVVDSHSNPPRAISVTCGNQSIQGVTERVWCWAATTEP